MVSVSVIVSSSSVMEAMVDATVDSSSPIGSGNVKFAFSCNSLSINSSDLDSTSSCTSDAEVVVFFFVTSAGSFVALTCSSGMPSSDNASSLLVETKSSPSSSDTISLVTEAVVFDFVPGPTTISSSVSLIAELFVGT